MVLQDAATGTRSFIVPDIEADTTFIFDLVVVDDRGASSSDTTQVYVTTCDDMWPVGLRVVRVIGSWVTYEPVRFGYDN